jgi:hypothetical protein
MDRATESIEESIEQEIDHEREMLRSNLAELEARVKSVVDWRRAYRNNTATLLGLAFGGALLTGLLVRRRSGELPGIEFQPSRASGAARPEARRREISLAWRTIESALIGVAASHLKDLLARVVPGFREQLARRDGDGKRHEGAARYRS